MIGLVGAFVAALCYGAASVLQAIGVRKIAASQRLDARLLVRLAGQATYVGGLLLDLVGFVASIAALRTLPLFLVQSAVAASVGVTAVLAPRFLGTRLGRGEVVALVTLAGGLAALAWAAQPEQVAPITGAGGWTLLAGAGVLTAGAVVAARTTGRFTVASLAVTAGLAFAGVGVAARGLQAPRVWWHIAVEPTMWALAGYGVLGMLAFATALQRGSVTVASAVTMAVETLVPSAVGLAVLGDSVRPGAEPLAGLGFALALGGALALAGFGEPAGRAPAEP